jgi:hypothetical protein
VTQCGKQEKHSKMKTKKIELDVDFIGGQGSLTIDEEKALSKFFKKRKQQPKKKTLIQKNKEKKLVNSIA